MRNTGLEENLKCGDAARLCHFEGKKNDKTEMLVFWKTYFISNNRMHSIDRTVVAKHI